MKKILLTILVLSIVSLSSLSAFASNQANGVILNGMELKSDIKPIIKEGRTLVPARVLLETLGLEITWNNKTRTVIGQNSNHKIELKVDEEYGHKYNDVDLSLDISPIIVKDRTLVPVRIVAELLGLSVKWDARASKVIMETNYQTPPLSLEDAHNIMVKFVQDSGEQNFVFMPYNSYASRWPSIVDTTYIFSVEVIGEDYGYMYDSNYCVNKYTGYIYEYHPGIGDKNDYGSEYFYSKTNPTPPLSEEFRYPDYKEK